MAIGLVGRKSGMTRIFTADGRSIPVTVLEIEPNRITQIKTVESDGYCAWQVTTGRRRSSRVTNPMKGHFRKAQVEPGRGLWEFRVGAVEVQSKQVGEELTVELFQVGQLVDVTGKTKGKGFAGCIKRHHFSSQRASHGNSLSHRVPGSIGQNQTPGRVFKGKRMAGHLGDVVRTTQDLEVIRVDLEHNAILVKGAVPGAVGGDVIIRPAVKAHVHSKTKSTEAA